MKKYLVEIFAIAFVVIGGLLAFYLKENPHQATRVRETHHRHEEAPTPIQKQAQAQAPSHKEAEPRRSEAEPRRSLVNFSIPVDVNRPLKIGLVGESRGDIAQDEAFNEKILRTIFEIFKKQGVETVFFTGNLVSGLPNSKVSTGDGSQEAIGPNPEVLRQQLNDFSQLYANILGTKMPLFPMMGDYESAVPQGSQVFRDHFHLENSISFDDGTFGYTVAMGDGVALF